MSEKVKYFAAYFTEDAGILEAALKNYIFMLSPPLKSIKVSGAAGTKEKKTFFFSLKKFSFTKKNEADCRKRIT